jgi:hypothetical protein
LIESPSKGAGSSITTVYGLKIEDQSAGGTNYALYTGLGTVQFGDNVNLTNGNLAVDWTRVGNDVRTLIRNNDNTNGASNAISYVIVGGASSGDAYSRYSISGIKDFSVGIDNSDSDAFVVSESGTPGTSNRFKIAVGGAVSIPGTLDVTGVVTFGDNLTVGATNGAANGSSLTLTGKTGFTNPYTLDTSSNSGSLTISVSSAVERFVSLQNTGAGVMSLIVEGTITGSNLIVTTSQTPASASATGTTGTIAWDSGFLYVCVATNTWKRVAIATW